MRALRSEPRRMRAIRRSPFLTYRAAPQLAVLTRSPSIQHRHCGKGDMRVNDSEGTHMTHVAIALGKASQQTRDFSGSNWWDNLTWTFRALRIWW